MKPAIQIARETLAASDSYGEAARLNILEGRHDNHPSIAHMVRAIETDRKQRVTPDDQG